MSSANDVSIVVNGRKLTGWQDVNVTRGIEIVPGSFTVGGTESYPTDDAAILVKPGDPCVLNIGPNPVITGYIDRVVPSVTPSEHRLTIMGRGKCQDIVDCSAVITNSQISATNALALAQTLAAPFNTKVASLSGNGPGIPQFTVMLGETAFEIIDRVARYAGLLAYEGADGNLILAVAGAAPPMSTGFNMPGNVQAASAEFTMDERFSEYIAVMMSVDKLVDYGGQSGNLLGKATDKGVPRFRPRILVSEQYILDQFIALKRAQWEAARRFGRSQAITLTCDDWRDEVGTLWTPNAAAALNVPQLKVVQTNWIISQVAYQLSQSSGTTAELTLMPREAFTPEPSILALYDWQVSQELPKGDSK